MMNHKDNNLKILGIIFLCEFAISALMYVFVFFVFGLSSIMAIAGAKNADASAFLVSVGVPLLIIAIALLLIIPLGIAGWKLLKNKPNARFWGVVASFLSVFFMCPLGLIVSILGFLFLFGNPGNSAHRHAPYKTDLPNNPNVRF
jgi:hypothetical protein